MKNAVCFFRLFFICAVIAAYAPTAMADLVYSFNEETGVLTITGDGPMVKSVEVNKAIGRTVPYAENSTLKQIDFSGATGITSIGDAAFHDCIGITGLNLPDGLETIGASGFTGCAEISDTLALPSGLISIDRNAFTDCSAITHLSLPSSLTSIGISAFMGCIGITGTLILPSKLTFIGSGAFMSCSGITGPLTLPDELRYLGDGAFQYCKGITGTLTLPDKLEFIGRSAFADCTGLSALVLTSSALTSFSPHAFAHCSNVISLVFPPKLSSIGYEVFRDCSSLTSLTIPDHIRTIGYGAFRDCIGLASLTLPSGIKSMENYAFYQCDSLSSITCLSASAPTVGTDAFSSGPISRTLWVPNATSGFGDDNNNEWGATKVVYGSVGTEQINNSNVCVYGVAGAIVIEGIAGDAEYSVYDTSGVVATSTTRATSSSSVKVSVKGGIYVVNVAGKVVKVVVK